MISEWTDIEHQLFEYLDLNFKIISSNTIYSHRILHFACPFYIHFPTVTLRMLRETCYSSYRWKSRCLDKPSDLVDFTLSREEEIEKAAYLNGHINHCPFLIVSLATWAVLERGHPPPRPRPHELEEGMIIIPIISLIRSATM